MIELVTKIRAPETLKRGPKTDETEYKMILDICSSEQAQQRSEGWAYHRQVGEFVVCLCEIEDYESQLPIDLYDTADRMNTM